MNNSIAPKSELKILSFAPSRLSGEFLLHTPYSRED